MSWTSGSSANCDGCHGLMEFRDNDLTFMRTGGGVEHYHQACWQTGWYTGIEPKGEWPIAEPVDADPVNSPSHYRWLPNGIEVIDITETLNFCLGNAIKYILRADHKGKPEEDLAKAAWYIQRELDRRERDNGNKQPVV